MLTHHTIPALAVHQLGTKVIAFQWIFAFVIMSLLFIASLMVAVPAYFGKELTLTPDSDDLIDQDRERQPLLNSGVISGQESST